MAEETVKNYKIEDTADVFDSMKKELGKVIIGQEAVVENLLTALFAGGHILIEGIPGLGKTLLASSLAYIVNGNYKRIQFTPDLMPSDIIGTSVYNSEKNSFSVKKGPVFTNLLLADEINRAPAKHSLLCSRQCRKKKSLLTVKIMSLKAFLHVLQHRIQLKWKELILFLKHR